MRSKLYQIVIKTKLNVYFILIVKINFNPKLNFSTTISIYQMIKNMTHRLQKFITFRKWKTVSNAWQCVIKTKINVYPIFIGNETSMQNWLVSTIINIHQMVKNMTQPFTIKIIAFRQWKMVSNVGQRVKIKLNVFPILFLYSAIYSSWANNL